MTASEAVVYGFSDDTEPRCAQEVTQIEPVVSYKGLDFVNVAERRGLGVQSPAAVGPLAVETPYRRHHHRPGCLDLQNPLVLCVRARRHTARHHQLAAVICHWNVIWSTYVLKSAYGLIDVAGRVLIKLFVMTENNDGDIDGAKDGEFVSFLEQTTFPLEKCPVWS